MLKKGVSLYIDSPLNCYRYVPENQ